MEKTVQALQGSYLAACSDEHRKQCQEYLMHTDGLMPHLIEIIMSYNDSALQLASAIRLKNMVTARWNMTNVKREMNEGLMKQELSTEEKELFCTRSFSLLECIINVTELRKLVFVAIKHAMDGNMEDYIKVLFNPMAEYLAPGSSSTKVLTALQPLRIILDKSAGYCDNEAIRDEIVIKFMPHILHWCNETTSVPCFATHESASVVTALVKVVRGCLDQALPSSGDALPVLIDAYPLLIKWLIRVAAEPVPNVDPTQDQADRNASPAMKAVKNTVRTLNKGQFMKHCPTRTVESTDPRRDLFLQSQLPIDAIVTFTELLTRCQLYDDRISISVMTALCSCIESHATYAVLKNHIPFLIGDICQKWMSYNEDDVERWEEDPIEVARSDNDYAGCTLAQSSMRFVQALCRLRGKDWLEYILSHITKILEEVAKIPQNVRLETVTKSGGVDAQKDGALSMLAGIASRLKHRKLPMDQVFLDHVIPECESQNPFLRRRACHVIREFLDSESEPMGDCSVSETTMIRLYQCVLLLMKDQEIPIRSQAGVTVMVFFGHCGPDSQFPALRKIVEDNFKLTVTTLFSMTEEEGLNDNNGIVRSISELMASFETAAVPYVADITQQLVKKLDDYLERGEDDDDHTVFGPKWQTALQVIETMTTIMDSMDNIGHKDAFTEIEPLLSPMIYKLSCGIMDDLELMEDGLTLLERLSFSIPAFTPSMWALYSVMAVSIVGGTLNQVSFPLPGMQIPPELLNENVEREPWCLAFGQVIAVMDNFICFDANTFVNGSQTFNDGTSISYLDMTYKIIQSKITLDNEDYEDDTLSAIGLIGLCFEGFCGLEKSGVALDRIKAFGLECVRLTWNHIEAVKKLELSEGEKYPLPKPFATHLALVVRVWAGMIVWDPVIACEILAEAGILEDALKLLFAAGRPKDDKVIFNNGVEGPRIIMMACGIALKNTATIPQFAAAKQGIAETCVLSLRALATYMQSCLDEENDYEELLGGDSEQELDENEDAKLTKRDLFWKELKETFLDDDLDNDLFEWRSMDIRKSPVTEMDEYALLEEVLPLMQDSIGPDGVEAFKEEIQVAYKLNDQYKKQLDL